MKNNNKKDTMMDLSLRSEVVTKREGKMYSTFENAEQMYKSYPH